MLVLSRMKGEEVVVEHCGEVLRITVCDFRRDAREKVRLGFNAPASFKILRVEISKTDEVVSPAE
jgi:carbon storage regulator CsrA